MDRPVACRSAIGRVAEYVTVYCPATEGHRVVGTHLKPAWRINHTRSAPAVHIGAGSSEVDRVGAVERMTGGAYADRSDGRDIFVQSVVIHFVAITV